MTRYCIHVAEIDQNDGSLEGGYKLNCKNLPELFETIKDLESEISSAYYDDDYYYYPPIKYTIIEVASDKDVTSKILNFYKEQG